jgi:hypothetical protein
MFSKKQKKIVKENQEYFGFYFIFNKKACNLQN